MSYRSLKRSLGETNLERKCRWLFGACLLPLIALSFWWYGSQTDEMLWKQFRLVAEQLAYSATMEAHFTNQEQNPSVQRVDEITAEMFRKTKGYSWQVLYPPNDEGIGKPTDGTEWELMEKWTNMGKKLVSDDDIKNLDPQSYQFLNPVEPSLEREDETTELEAETSQKTNVMFQYYEPLFARSGCVECHSKLIAPVYRPDLHTGDLFGVIRVDIPADELKSAQEKNQGLLWVAAIATVFLAMIVLYIIVHFIIVKPLRHLRDVSDAVRRGDVEQRAILHTGDEYEELAASFNRMLRQLLRQQDELREVNGELDLKIDEMAQANMRLFEMNQLKSDFLATVSHELRTPLNSIIGFSDLLGSADHLEDKQKRYATNIQRSGRQLLDMINDILDLAKIESGKMELRLCDFQIAAVVAAQCDMARPLSEKKNIDLEYETMPGLPPMMQDQGKLEQILNNLLSNAIKFTPEGGRINVAARQDRSGDLRLSVTDTGVGISDEEQTLVFEKFRQGTTVLAGGNAMTREYSGTGLGLSIVRELCRLMGGEITLESELGKGSTFTVLLPWTMSQQQKIESPLADELNQLTKSRPELPTVATNPAD